MNRKAFFALTASLMMVGTTPALAQAAGSIQAPGAATERYALTISDALRRFENLETMRVAVNTSPGLGVLLSSGGTYTLFAPTNDAFSRITQTQLNRIVSGRASLGHYVVKGTLTREVLREMLLARGGQMTLPTVGGAPLAFALDGQGNIVVGGVARLIGQPEVVGNGVIYPVSAVISAPRAAGGLSDTPVIGGVGGLGEIGGGLRQALGALETGDLETARGFLGEVETNVGTTLGGLNEEQLGGEIGTGLRELQTGLGELGGINEVGALRERVGGLYQGFTQTFGAGVGAAVGTGLATGRTISDALRTIDGLQTFRAAVNASPRIGRILSTPGTYTLFAPTNDAFSVITQTQLNSIVSGNSDIGHYVVEGTLTPEILRQMLLARGGQMSLSTVTGGNIALTLEEDGNIIVGGVARILGSEIYGNGTILPISNVVTAPTAQSASFGVGISGATETNQGVGVGTDAGIGTGADVGAAGAGAGVGEIGALIDPIRTSVLRTREALAADDLEAARGFYDEAQVGLETALGRAQGETLTALRDIQTRLGEIGGITDVQERERLLIEVERDLEGLY